MSKRLGRALIILFVVGLMVSFSSLLFLVIFFNFSQIPPAWVISSIAGCATLQIIAFFGSVAFKQRIWPAVLMLVCGVATAWVGVLGPATLFGMPSAVLANPEGVNPFLYAATLPVTVVGAGVGIAYFVLGVICLVLDALAIQKKRTAPAPSGGEGGEAGTEGTPPDGNEASAPPPVQDKQVIYSQVVKMLGVPPGGEDAEAEGTPPEDTAEALATPQAETDMAAPEETKEEPAGKASAAAEPVIEKTPPGEAADVPEAALAEAPTATREEPVEPPMEAPASAQPPVTPSIAEAPDDARTAPAKPAPRGPFARVAAFFRAEPPADEKTDVPPAAAVLPQPAEELPAAALPDTEPPAEIGISPLDIPAEFPIDSVGFSDNSVNTVQFSDSEADPVASEADFLENTGASPEIETQPEPQPSQETNSVPAAATPPPKPVEEPAFVGQPRAELLAQWGTLPVRPIPAGDLGVTLETERLRIIRLDRAAFASLLEGVDEMERVTGLAPSGERLDAGTVAAFKSLYQQAADDPANYKWYAVWLITSKSENKLMGSAGFKDVPADDGEVELGYGLHEARRGNGYGPEAVVALCRWGMMQREVQSVLAETGPDEAAKTLEEAGMQPVEKAGGGHYWRMAE